MTNKYHIGVLSFTNETIDAILNGLSIQSNDRIISICSCGAQPLAFIENLSQGSILAVDFNPNQFQFTKNVIELIKTDDVSSLKKFNLAPKDFEYFSDKDRLIKISNNLDKLDFLEFDVTQKPDFKQRFTKGYFSNADVNLRYFHPVFDNGALIYVAFATSNLPNNLEKFLDNRSVAYGCDIRSLYDVDIERTNLACSIESKHPIVYHDSIKNGSMNCDWTPCIFRKK